MTFETKFSLRQQVVIDGDPSLAALVTCVQFRIAREPIYEVSWVHNGDLKSAWVEEFRLK
jgi:hypothetical protein